MCGGDIVLHDWDEARVDDPYFDLAALPQALAGLDDREWIIAQRASAAWETAVSWLGARRSEVSGLQDGSEGRGFPGSAERAEFSVIRVS